MKSIVKTLLLGSACALALTAAASAADLGVIPLRGSVGMWNGFYGGVNGGYAWTEGDAVTFDSHLGLRPNTSGSLFGGQIGYNWQFTPEWVFGVETDFDWTNIDGRASALAAGPINPNLATFIATQKINMLGTARVRAGYVLDDVLLYATAGLAYGQVESNMAISEMIGGLCGPVGFCATASSKEWMVGWAAGLGFDWSFLPRWSFRTEYLHYDLGSQHQTLGDPQIPGVLFTSDANLRGDIVRGAINYRFF
jgi:outer membrane immunogenic protein